MTLSRSSVHSSLVEDVHTMAVTSVGHRTSDGLGSEANVFMKWFAQGKLVLFGPRSHVCIWVFTPYSLLVKNTDT